MITPNALADALKFKFPKLTGRKIRYIINKKNGLIKAQKDDDPLFGNGRYSISPDWVLYEMPKLLKLTQEEIREVIKNLPNFNQMILGRCG